jgi:hypothetical protein
MRSHNFFILDVPASAFTANTNQNVCTNVLPTQNASSSTLDYCNCILGALTPFANVDLGAATSILVIIPTVLQMLQANGPGIERAFNGGWVQFVLSVLAGHATAGASASEMYECLRRSGRLPPGHGKLAAEDDEKMCFEIDPDPDPYSDPDAETARTTASRHLANTVTSCNPWVRHLLRALAFVLLACAWLILGLLGTRTVVIWKKDVEFLHVIWFGVRAAGPLFEFACLCGVRWYYHYHHHYHYRASGGSRDRGRGRVPGKEQMVEQSQDQEHGRTQAFLPSSSSSSSNQKTRYDNHSLLLTALSTTRLLAITFDGFALVFGTCVLGATTMIGAPTALKLFFGFVAAMTLTHYLLKATDVE